MTFASSSRVKIFNLNRDLLTQPFNNRNPISVTIGEQKAKLKQKWKQNTQRKPTAIDFSTKTFSFFIGLRIRSFTIFKNVYQSYFSFSSFRRNDFKSCHMSISVATSKRRVESYFLSNVMHTTTNVNSLTSWQTINNWRGLKLQNIWRRVKQK